MEADELKAVVEAILLTAGQPVTAQSIVEAIASDLVDSARVTSMLEELKVDWDSPSRGLRLETVAGGWRLVTPPQLNEVLRAFHGLQSRQRLSQAALEVLSIVAHRQPVTLPEINFIRGTGSSGVVRTLLERRLLRMAGRKKVVGKPFLYRTTKEFLIHFGLERVEDLPEPETMLEDSSTLALEPVDSLETDAG